MAHLTDASASSAIGSTSTSSDASPNTNYSHYDVFINNRDPDIKKTLAGHLYHGLVSHGFQVFLDKQEMQVGEHLSSQIKGAIATASVHIAIFSPKYAESKWCLDELLLMLESKATVIPIFYHVAPSDLRIRTGKVKDGLYSRVLTILGRTGSCSCSSVYAHALRIHEKKRRYNPQIIAKWRKALSEVSNLSGFDLETFKGDEGELVEKVVQQVEEKVRKSPLEVATSPTGLDEKLEDFEETVSLQKQRHAGKAKVVGIVGSGGAGKTTLAVEFFHRRTSYYDRSCFLMDVRGASLISLQNKLIKDLASLDLQIDNIAGGKGLISHHLSGIRALLILDDVDHACQLDALFSPLQNVLGFHSLILITSRNKDVLSEIGDSIYKLTGLDRKHSRELFCLHAFHKRLPVVGFEEMVTKFLGVCDGLPLSLKVIGSLLYEQKLQYWEAQLEEISKVFPSDIQSRLKISYDSLDWQEKEIFLDIACFFIGENKDKAVRVWEGSGWEGSLNLHNLKNKCLVEMDSKNCIRMHDHIRDLGRHLAERDPPSFRRRLWRLTDDIVCQPSIVRGISMVKHISVSGSLENPVLGNRFVDMIGVQLLKTEGDCLENISDLLRQSNLLWLRWDNYPYSSLPSWIPTKNLRVLQVAGSKLETLWQSENEAPLLLRELNIGVTLSQFPKSIGLLKQLEKIEMKDIIGPLPEEFFHLSSLKHLSLQTRMMCLSDSLENLTNLQYIDLSGSRGLQMLPSSFGCLIDLRHVNLNQCEALQMLPKSFGNLIRLKHLSLAGCRKLTISSETFGNISTLESLDLSHCLKMEVLPPQITRQSSLEEMNLLHTNFKDLPSAIGNLDNLKILKLQCHLLEMLPPSFGDLRNLKELRLHFCNNLKSLPDSIAELKQLTTLMIANAGIECLPVGVTQLNNLEILSVRYCPLSKVPFASVEKVGGGKEEITYTRGRRMLDSSIHKCMRMFRLKHLDLHGTRIREISFPPGVCPNLRHLNISFCRELVEVGALPTKLISLDLQECPALANIRGLSGLAKLRLLDISRSNEIEDLPGLETLTSLEELRGAFDCKKLQKSVRKLAEATVHMHLGGQQHLGGEETMLFQRLE